MYNSLFEIDKFHIQINYYKFKIVLSTSFEILNSVTFSTQFDLKKNNILILMEELRFNSLTLLY